MAVVVVDVGEAKIVYLLRGHGFRTYDLLSLVSSYRMGVCGSKFDFVS